MKLFLFISILSTSLVLNGQTLKYYDSLGNLIVDKKYSINLSNIDYYLQLEKYIENVIAPLIEYPSIAYENGLHGMGIISIRKADNNTSISLVKGTDPSMDMEVIRKMDLLKSLLADTLTSDFTFYVPYEFKYGDESVRTSTSLNIIYPGNQAKMILKDSIKLFVFKTEFELTEKEIIEIDNLLFNKFEEYVRKQKGGLAGINLLNKKEYREYLKKQKARLIAYNRSYYCRFNANHEKILEIVLAKEGIHGSDVIEYNLLTNRIDIYYINACFN